MNRNESRGSRLMRKLGGLQGEDMGAGGDSGGGGMMSGSSVGGDAGLSQLGAIPNGVGGLITGQQREREEGDREKECDCGAPLSLSMMYCPECGREIRRKRRRTENAEDTYIQQESFEERFNNYLDQQRRQQQQDFSTKPRRVQTLSESVSSSQFEEMVSHVRRVEEKLEALYRLVERLQ